MAKNKDPAVLFYTDDFLAGTMTMTDSQVGKYIRLLCLQHQQGHPPEATMLFVCKKPDPVIWAKFKQDDDGLFYNQRMEVEGEKRSAYNESRRQNKLGKTKKHMKNICSTHEEHMGNGIYKRNIPPLLEDVIEYCKERGNRVDPSVWYDFYASKNWMVGKNKMTDWRAAVRTWERSRQQTTPQRKKSFAELAKEMEGEL